MYTCLYIKAIYRYIDICIYIKYSHTSGSAGGVEGEGDSAEHGTDRGGEGRPGRALLLPRVHRRRHVFGVRRCTHPTPYRPLNSKAFCSRRKPAQGVRLWATCGTYPMMCSTATTGPLTATCVWSTKTYRPPPPYRGTSLIRNIPLPGLYSKTVPRFPWWS